MTLPITVTTASIPGRERLLGDAIMSVNEQHLAPAEHLIRVTRPDCHPRLHLAKQRNALLDKVSTEWLAILDDDDVYLPHHFHAIRQALETDADVVYTFARHGCVAREDVSNYSPGQLLERLAPGNCISSNAALRAETVRAVSGWSEDFDDRALTFGSGATFEDWDMWIQLARIGAKFLCVPVETWDYRSGDWTQMSR